MHPLDKNPEGFYCLKFLLKSLKVFGLWHTPDDKFLYTCYSFFIISLQISYLITNMWTVVTKSSEWKSVSSALEDIIVVLSSAFSCYKIFIIMTKLKMVLKGVEKLNKEWKDLYIESEEEEELIRSGCKFEKKLSRIVFANGQIIVSALILSGISKYIRNLRTWRLEIVGNNTTLEFPYEKSLPFISPVKITSTILFGIMWAHMSVNLVLAAQASSNVDCIIWFWTYHVSNYFEILTMKIKRANFSRNELRGLIEFHKELISECKNIQNVLGPIMSLQFSLSSIMLCMGLFQITQVDSSRPMLYVKHIFYLTYKLVQMYMNCWFAQRLVDKSEAIASAVYSSDFYNYLNKSTLATLKFMIMRSRKPCRISAFGFINISNKTFKNIMENSYSYFTLLKSF